MSKIRAVIIDDEYFNRELIAMLIGKANQNFEVCGSANSVRDGLKIINECSPEVVFLDIKMPDGTGFDLLRKLEPIRFEVIFVTGFDNYALQAFDFNALDYVLKPIDIDKFRHTLDRVEQRLNRADHRGANVNLRNFSQDNLVNRIPVIDGEETVFLKLSEIVFISEEQGKTVVATISRKYNATRSLADMEFILREIPAFVKMNETCFVNAGFVERISKDQKTITMQDKSEFSISPSRAPLIIDLISQQMG
jgi:two-component system, LytTR family, response regulator